MRRETCRTSPERSGRTALDISTSVESLFEQATRQRCRIDDGDPRDELNLLSEEVQLSFATIEPAIRDLLEALACRQEDRTQDQRADHECEIRLVSGREHEKVLEQAD